MNIRMRQLRVFKAVVEAGTVSDAAFLLSLTQSSVSKTLAALEQELGFLLFDRIGRRLKLSREGKLFYKKIENAIEAFEAIRADAEDIRDNHGRRLRVCAIGPLLCSKLIPVALNAFSQKHPDFNYSVDLVNRIDIEDWVARQHSDLGFTLLPVETTQLNYQSLATVHAVAILPKAHKLAGSLSLNPSQICAEHLIMPGTSVRIRGLAEASFAQAGVPLKVHTQTTSAISMAHLVASGLGIGILDPFTASGVRDDEIVAIPWQPEIKLNYGVIWQKSRTLSANETDFIDTVQEVVDALVMQFK